MSNQQNRLVLLPRRLTAEIGAKTLLSGVFYETITLNCSACHFDEPQDDCEVCGGEVEYEQKVMVSWDTIKEIWTAAADEFSLLEKPLDSLLAPVAHVKHLVNSAIIDSTGCTTRWEDLPDGTPLYTHPAQPVATIPHASSQQLPRDVLMRVAEAVKNATEKAAWLIDGLDVVFERVDIAAIVDTALSGMEQHTDDVAVDRFAMAMKAKLAASRAKGRGGWDDPEKCTPEFLAELLCGHIGKGNAGTFEDVANFAMMLHQRGAEPSVLASAAHKFWKDHRFTAAERHAVEQAISQLSANQPEPVNQQMLAALKLAHDHMQCWLSHYYTGHNVYTEVSAAIDAAAAAQAQQPQAEGVPDDDLADFAKTIGDFEACEETDTPYDTLMRWAAMGWLECIRFDITPKGRAALAAAPKQKGGAA